MKSKRRGLLAAVCILLVLLPSLCPVTGMTVLPAGSRNTEVVPAYKKAYEKFGRI